MCPQVRLACGMDLNTQLSQQDGIIGQWVGTGEREGEGERASLCYGFLWNHSLKVASTYCDHGPTRRPWPKCAEQQQSTVIDFLAVSSGTPFRLEPENQPKTFIHSDHRPIGMLISARTKNRNARRRTFEQTLAAHKDHCHRLPTGFQPAKLGQYHQQMRTLEFESLNDLPKAIKACAHAASSQESQADQTKKGLINGLRKAQNPWIRKAYQYLLRKHQLQVKANKEKVRLLDWAKGKDWSFAKPHKLPNRLKLPESIDNVEDRGRWGDLLHAYMTILYNAPHYEREDVKILTWVIQNKAAHATPIVCDPHVLRDMVRKLPAYKAPGKDGIPSQCLKHLGWKSLTKLAELYTALANDMNYETERRPKDWDTALVYMLPKIAGARFLAQHRPISLMSQAQKLFTRWLTHSITPHCEQLLIEEQMGFRRYRQAAEIIHAVRRVIEVQAEWGHHLTIIKVDLAKAFDTVFQSGILRGLLGTSAHPRHVFNLTREMIHSRIMPDLWGTQPEHDIPLLRGSRQGAPESGLLFIMAINQSLAKLQQTWKEYGWGVAVGGTLLNSLVFVDDILLLAMCPEDGKLMLQQLEGEFQNLGLRLNAEKTSFLTTLPNRGKTLPGKCVSDSGLPVVGRMFQLRDNTADEVARRIQMSWSKYHSLKPILRQKTPLSHRLAILNACVYQSLLWGSHSWTVTRKRCQQLRGFEKQIMRGLIPCPKSFQDLPRDEKFQKWDDLVSQTLAAENHTSLDQRWLGRWHGWAGHTARLPASRWALRTQQHRNISWWRGQQDFESGFRHHGKRAHLARWENVLDRYHPLKHRWEISARNREEWARGKNDFIFRVLGWEKHVTELPSDHLNPAQALVLDTQVTSWVAPKRKRQASITQNQDHHPQTASNRTPNTPMAKRQKGTECPIPDPLAPHIMEAPLCNLLPLGHVKRRTRLGDHGRRGHPSAAGNTSQDISSGAVNEAKAARERRATKTSSKGDRLPGKISSGARGTEPGGGELQGDEQAQRQALRQAHRQAQPQALARLPLRAPRRPPRQAAAAGARHAAQAPTACKRAAPAATARRAQPTFSSSFSRSNFAEGAGRRTTQATTTAAPAATAATAAPAHRSPSSTSSTTSSGSSTTTSNIIIHTTTTHSCGASSPPGRHGIQGHNGNRCSNSDPEEIT